VARAETAQTDGDTWGKYKYRLAWWFLFLLLKEDLDFYQNFCGHRAAARFAFMDMTQ